MRELEAAYRKEFDLGPYEHIPRVPFWSWVDGRGFIEKVDKIVRDEDKQS